MTDRGGLRGLVMLAEAVSTHVAQITDRPGGLRCTIHDLRTGELVRDVSGSTDEGKAAGWALRQLHERG